MHRPDHNTIEAVSENEHMLFEVYRHPFGLVATYLLVAIGFAAAALLLWFLAPIAFSGSSEEARRNLVITITGVGAIFAWLLLMLYTYIYRQSKLIITDKNLTQVLQHGLFNRKVSELSMANVEDVTSHQRGAFASIVGYGDLIVETAGEQANFKFVFCPKPSYYGKLILDARQQFLDENDRN